MPYSQQYYDEMYKQGATTPVEQNTQISKAPSGQQNANDYFNTAPDPNKQAAKTGMDAAGDAAIMSGNPYAMAAGVGLKMGSSLMDDSGDVSRGQKAQEQRAVNKTNVSSAAWRTPYSNAASESIAKSQGSGGLGNYIATTGKMPSKEDAAAMITGGASNPRQVAANEAELQKQQQEIDSTRLKRRRRLQQIAPVAIIPFAMGIRRIL